MHSIGYNIPIQPRPEKKRNYIKLLFMALAFSVLFVKHPPTIDYAKASLIEPTPTDEIELIDNYLIRKEESPNPPVYSKSYILMDASNGDVLASKSPNLIVPVASITKMVTALVAMEEFDLNEVVEVDKLAANINGSEIKLIWGEKITVRDLIKGLLVQSGNDAAFALAEHYSGEPGNYEKFVARMNEYVKKLGLNNTVFGDPAGLDDEIGRSTSWDLAHVARELLKNDFLRQVVAIPKTTIASIDGKFVHELESSNRLILNDSSYYLPGVIGVKTGFTPDAGHCLVSAYNFSDRMLIGVVLNTNEFTITASANETRKLYNWANRYIEKRSY